MTPRTAIFSKEIFRFFRDLKRHNRTAWMHANRERYQQHVVQPFRELLARVASDVQDIAPGTTINGQVGTNFSRINRDIRFAKDKSPYRPRMYLMLPDGTVPEADGLDFYAGIHVDEVTLGLRAYGNHRQSLLRTVTAPRALAHAAWLAAQARRLSRKYESYWHATEKGEWVKHPGWPKTPEEWKRIGAWIVRRKLPTVAATRPGFEKELIRTFRDLAPLHRFLSDPVWKPSSRKA